MRRRLNRFVQRFWMFGVFDRKKYDRIADLEQVNAELKGSLDRCRALLSECRGKLAANTNAAQSAEDSDLGLRQNCG